MAAENNQLDESSICDKSPSNFSYLYKQKPSKEESQETRRRNLLEEQKKKRRSLQDQGRILKLVEDIEEDSKTNDAEKSKGKNNSVAAKKINAFRDQLMFSEWMEELPSDFEKEWLMITCPKGIRMLIVANKGSTKAYTKKGRPRYEFQSLIPGGGRKPNLGHNHKNICTVLDCVYSPTSEVFYILDLLAWGNQPFTDCEAEFRFFWLKGKVSEMEELSQKDPKWNPYPFILLPPFTTQEHSVSTVLNQWPIFANDDPALDGLLFYHKNAHYTSGITPTVLWLLPFMIPEVISTSINIHSNFMNIKPANYINQQLFIQQFNEEQKRKKVRKWHAKNDLMFAQMELGSNESSANNEVSSSDQYIPKSTNNITNNDNTEMEQ